jgi:hypothetical protein
MSQLPIAAIATVGIDIGKNSFHVVGLDQRGAIVLRQKWSRSQVDARFANMPPCLIGMEACVGADGASALRPPPSAFRGSRIRPLTGSNMGLCQSSRPCKVTSPAP